MMKKLVITFVVFLPIIAFAQQQSAQDTAQVYRQLLSEANDRVAAAIAENTTLRKQLEDAKKASMPKESDKK